MEFSGGWGGSVRPKNLKKCIKLNWNFQRGGGGGGLRKNPFRGGGMDIFWNYTISIDFWCWGSILIDFNRKVSKDKKLSQVELEGVIGQLFLCCRMIVCFNVLFCTVTRAEQRATTKRIYCSLIVAYLPSKNSNMKQLTQTHHQNYLEVEHRSTGRCTPFALRHHVAFFPNPYTYQPTKLFIFQPAKSGSPYGFFAFEQLGKQKTHTESLFAGYIYLRNRKHVPCFYRVIKTRVEVWENEKCGGNTSCRQVFPQLFRVLPNFHECLYNSIETWSTCFLFLLENKKKKKRKTTF